MLNQEEVQIGSGIAAAVALGLMIWAFVYLRRYRLVRDTPTSRCQGVFIGFVELKGTAESESPLTSYLSKETCIHYRWTVEEKWSRLVNETYTDSKGKTRTRVRRETGWQTVDSGGEEQPFYLLDSTGAVLIQPEKATIDSSVLFSTYAKRGDALYYEKGPDWEVTNSVGFRRFTEKGIRIHQPIYVLGQARERSDCVAAEIAYDKSAPTFLISTADENAIRRGYGWRFGLLTFLSGAVSITWPLILLNENAIGIGWLITASSVFFAILLSSWIWSTFNNMIGLRNRVNQAKSLIDVQFKRRHDLIPSLVDCVKALRDHERVCQEVLTLIRSQQQLGGRPLPLLPAMLAVKEAYPELHAEEGFLLLQKILTDAEDRIALSLNYFNEMTTAYNTAIQTFPAVLLACLCGLRERVLFSAPDFTRVPPELHLK